MLPSHARVASQSWRQVFNLVSAYFTNLFDVASGLGVVPAPH